MPAIAPVERLWDWGDAVGDVVPDVELVVLEDELEDDGVSDCTRFKDQC